METAKEKKPKNHVLIASLPEEDIHRFYEIYSQRIRVNRKTKKSQIVSEGIRLLYNKEFPERVEEGSRTTKPKEIKKGVQ